jgi:hypothetical protein
MFQDPLAGHTIIFITATNTATATGENFTTSGDFAASIDTPEPSTFSFVLSGLGLVGMILVMRRA